MVPIQPLSLEQHGKNDSPSKITRRISSTEDSEDPLQSLSNNNEPTTKSKSSQAGGTKKGKQEEASGKKKRVVKETAGKRSKKTDQEGILVTSAPTTLSVSSPEPIFLTPPLDSTSKVANVSSKVLSTQVVQPTPPYTPTHEATQVTTAENHQAQSQSSPVPLNDTSMDNLSLTSESKDTPSSLHDKLPHSDSKSISLTCFNVDILNNEDDKSASPAVVTIDPNAITHSPVNNSEPTSTVTERDPIEERPFVEVTKKTASIISNKNSPNRPSLLPFRRRSLSATSSQVAAKQPVSGGRGRRKSEGGRNNQVIDHVIILVFSFNFILSDKETTTRGYKGPT